VTGSTVSGAFVGAVRGSEFINGSYAAFLCLSYITEVPENFIIAIARPQNMNNSHSY
jgi:hypothetical protein